MLRTHRTASTELGQSARVVIHLVPSDVSQTNDGVLEGLGELVLSESRQRRDHDDLKLHLADRFGSSNAIHVGKPGGSGDRVLVPLASKRKVQREELTIAAGGNVLEDDFDGRQRAVLRKVPDEFVPRRFLNDL